MSFETLREDHRPEGAEVFLDTSIHCSERKGPLFRPRIARVLKLFAWKGTSSYTKVEFGNVVLSQAEYLLRKLNELRSVAALRDHIANVLPHKLHPAKVIWSLNLLTEQYGKDDVECTERARLSLERLLKIGLSLVDAACDQPIRDGTACFWARKAVQTNRAGELFWEKPNCKRTEKRCRLDDFFSENKQVFLEIKQHIDSIPAERKTEQLSGFSDVIASAANDPGSLLDYKTGCRRLADALIAVDSLGFKNFFSQNERESGVLCEILKQNFYFLPPSAEKGVLVQLPIREEPALSAPPDATPSS